MLLVTTANQKFWDKKEKILFLGEWCKKYSDKKLWSKCNFETLPYHWDDRKKLYNDYLYLQELNERYLKLLTKNLNKVHKENRSIKYWRIIIGPWLHYFSAILFDRYKSLKLAIEKTKYTNISSSSIYDWIPKDMSNFVSMALSDNYNHILYTEIIKLLKIPNNVKEIKLTNKINKIDNGFKQLIKRSLSKISSCSSSKYLFISSYMPAFEKLLIEISLGQIPSFVSDQSFNYEIKINKEIRANEFKDLVFENEFEEILNKLIPLQLPSTYLEAYKINNVIAEKLFSKKINILYTSNSFSGNESFKFFSADKVEQGKKLIIGQHGGHYGTGLFSASENHETKISDYYTTWGWGKNCKLKTLPSGVLKKALKNIKKSKKEGFLLMILASFPRYSYQLFSAPISSQAINYFDDQIEFYSKLYETVKSIIRVRYDLSNDYGWSEKDRIKDSFPDIKEADFRESMHKQINSSRLVIGTYNATTYLETFAANFPTILFWNPNHWELRTESIKYFNALKEVGILHDTPESAAMKVNKIYDDPLKWWMSKKVQNAKDMFCKQYAYVSKDYKLEWKNFFSNVNNSYKNSK